MNLLINKGISIDAADARVSGLQVLFDSKGVKWPLQTQINVEMPPYKAQLKRRNFFGVVQDGIKLLEQIIWEAFEVN